MGAAYAELDRPLENTSLICRGCLVDCGEMKDMLEWGLVDDFCRITKVKLHESINLSLLLCTQCEEMLEKCKQFQMQCNQSDAVLRDLVQKKEGETTKSADGFDNVHRTSCIMTEEKLIVLITVSESHSKIFLSCPVEDCDEKFVKRHDLHQHLIRSHKVDKEYVVELQFYCVAKDCVYNISSKSNKWFTGRKNLNQHYKKVHKNKIYVCVVCNKKFPTTQDFNRHLSVCNMMFSCEMCDAKYNSSETLMVHLMRRHPEVHKQYKEDKAIKRKADQESDSKKIRIETEGMSDYMCDSPKRSLATQTLNLEENIRNDVSFYSVPAKNDDTEAKTDEISTQTVFEDLLSLKSQASEDDSIFFSESTSITDIQTQTFPVEFGLSRCNRKTITSETQSPDINIKETQTCNCHNDSPKTDSRLFESLPSSGGNTIFTSTETQTGEERDNVKCDALLSFNSAETQTYFNEDIEEDI